MKKFNYLGRQRIKSVGVSATAAAATAAATAAAAATATATAATATAATACTGTCCWEVNHTKTCTVSSIYNPMLKIGFMSKIGK